MNFIIKNQGIFPTNSSTHNINTRNKHHLHRPNANLTFFKKSTFYAGIKSFNSLPPSVMVLKNELAKFKGTLRKYLHIRSFYSVDEFFMSKDDLHYVEIKCQLDATEVFIADLIACSTCFGHHYAHHQ